VQQALKRINELYSHVLIWYYIDDLSISEISQILNKTEGAIRVLLHRALQSLKKAIEQI
jgi:RNA polymerase sigma factor (sigma-70 family)